MHLEKVLFIAYQFPPMGGPGVHRSIGFVKHLKKYGYEPIVLTILEEHIQKTGHTVDESLLQKIPDDIEINRIDSGQLFKWVQILQKLRVYRLFWFFLYPFFWEKSALWPYSAYKDAAELIKKHNIKIVYTSSGPFSPLILGKNLQKKLNVKWVADLRDPFTDAYAWSYPGKLHWRICRYFEKKILSKADHLIVNTPEVKRLYIQREILPEQKMSVITNGF